MIVALPSRIPGEAFESFASRIYARSYAGGLAAYRAQIKRISRRNKLSPNLLAAELAVPEWLPVANIIENHTVFPILRPFLDSEEADGVEERLANGHCNKNVSALLSEMIRYCPECRKTELEGIDGAGWLTLNQLYWMRRCQGHKCALWETDNSDGHTGPNTSIPVVTGVVSRANFEFLNAIERGTTWLAGAQVEPLGRNRWREYHKAALTREFGIAPPYSLRELYAIAHKVSGRVRYWLQLPMLCQYSNWLEAAINRPKSTAHPLYHLVVLRLCRDTISNAVSCIRTQSN
jgi:hypothetical protein